MTFSNPSEKFLRERGYTARPHTTPGIENPDTLKNQLPQKTVATRAGLGWIGKCALLITREFGSAVRLGGVLTDAEFSTGVPKDISECGDCTDCVDICPAGAITGEEWYAGIERDVLVDVFTCRKTAHELLMQRTGSEVIAPRLFP